MATTQKLLTPAQVTKCKTIVTADSEYNQRAAVLLAIHNGASQAEAATQTSLTIGQVRYWVAKFRRLAMAAFPATSVIKTEKSTKKPEKKNKQAKSKAKDKKKDKADKKKSKGKKDNKPKSAKKDNKKAKDKKKNKKK